MLRTGTSKTGAVHRYYACSTCARKGKTVCKSRSIPMAKLDIRTLKRATILLRIDWHSGLNGALLW
jgi:recombinase-like zinc beta ribbon protein